MKIVVGNFKKVYSKVETEKKLEQYSNSFFGDNIYFCVIPECAYLKTRFKLFAIQDDSCGRVLLGHSDYRKALKLDNKTVVETVVNNLSLGSEILYCIGETEEEKNKKIQKKIFKQQLKGLKKVNNEKLTIVYEPIFAIGKSEPANLDYVISNIKLIKKLLPKVKVVYGGSVNEENAKSVLEKPEIDGVFLHRACLNDEKLAKIIKIASKF